MGEGVSVKWACDYPSCTELSQEHKGWLRTEDRDKDVWLFMIVPFVSNLVALLVALTPDSLNAFARHYCPTHAKFLKGDKS